MPLRTILSLPILLYMFAAPAQTEDRPPNIVFIMADDLGYHELGAFGQEQIRTPNLDRLADQGIKLTRHDAGSAVCGPPAASSIFFDQMRWKQIRPRLKKEPDHHDVRPA